ncbi:MAG: hypothetical protein QOG54_2507 [Actinomycetota bacterium]|nr:hypothetical protein [Actinomycetota bacterium]
MKLRLLLVLALLAALAPAGASARAPEADQSENIKLIGRFPYVNSEPPDTEAAVLNAGTDIAFSGKYVYAMQQGKDGGIHTFENAKSGPKEVGFFACPGGQNDVAVVKPGLLIIGYHETQCGGPGAGVRLVDVRNAKHPTLLGAVNDLPGGTHTVTPYPGKDIVYASPGGLANGNGIEQIIDVSDPAKPKVAATFTPQRIGCHDLSFYFNKDEKLAICAGGGEAEVWDVSDPLVPVAIGHVAVPAQFPHSVAFTPDGKYFVIGDEAVSVNDCVGGPTGSLWVYDFAVREAPLLVGHFGPQRGVYPAGSGELPDNPVLGPPRYSWCTAHLFNFVPGTYTMVASWYGGGVNVIDFSDPTMPTEIAHYMGTGDDYTNYWSAYWYDGRIWANDRYTGGLDVFEVKGLKEGKIGR